MDIQTKGFLSIDQVKAQYDVLSNGNKKDIQGIASDFSQILSRKSIENGEINLKFSKHATLRLNDRGIELSRAQMERLEDGTRKAAQKGIKDSLVLMDELAFIVNVPNQTVVTAINSESNEEKVFTNINGAVIV